MLGSTFIADLREDEAGYENALALLQGAGHVFESVSEQAERELEDQWGLVESGVVGSLVRQKGTQPLVQSNEELWHGGVVERRLLCLLSTGTFVRDGGLG
jgi:hypothetical protein